MQKNDKGQNDFPKLSDSMQKSQLNFANLFANMAEGVALHEIVIDSNGTPENYRIIDVNPGFEKLLTLSRDSVVGKLATEAYRTTAPPFFSEYVTVAQERKPLAFSVYFEPMRKHFDISAVPWGENGFATIFFDITERKVAEASMLASEERLRRAIKFAPSPLAIFTESGEMLQISDSWTKITGYTHAEIPTVGDWARKAYPEIPVARKEIILSIFDSSVPIFHPEVSVITKQGETRTWSITAVPLGKLSDGQRPRLAWPPISRKAKEWNPNASNR